MADAAAPALTASGPGVAAREPRLRFRPRPRSSWLALRRLTAARSRQRRSGWAESGLAAPAGRLPGLARAARRPPGRYPREKPASRLLPRSRRRPHVVPVSRGKTLLLHMRASHKSLQSLSGFIRYPRRNPQKVPSYQHFEAIIHEFIHSLSSAWECEPENFGAADTGCNQLIFHIGWRVISGATGFDGRSWRGRGRRSGLRPSRR